MAQENKVYVTYESSHDFSGAEAFGEVHFLTKDDLNNTRNSLHNEALLSDLAFKLKKFNPDEDYIVIAGSPYVAAAVFMILGFRGIKSVKLLRWDSRDRKYIPLYMEFRQEAFSV